MKEIKNILLAIWHAGQWFYRLPREHKGYLIILTYIAILVTIIAARNMAKPVEYERMLHVEEAHAQEVEVEKPVIIEEVIVWDKARVMKEVDKQAAAFHTFADKMHTTVNCESQYNVRAHNKSDPYGGAYGVAQFLTPTFNKYAPLAGVENPDIHNPEHQLQTMAYMFSIGEAKQWTCFRMHYK